MRLNPIVKKDIRVLSRSMRICWSVFAYEAIMALVFFFAMLIIQQNNRYSSGNIYSSIVLLYPVLAVTQIVILGVVVPIRTASSISGEKERQTFDIMMTTSMTPFAIIWGKVTTAIVQDMFFVAASLPVMALAFVIGGLPWSYLFWFFGVALLVSFFSASIGIFCSSVCKKSITAVIMSYGFYIVFFVVTYLPMGVSQIFYISAGTAVGQHLVALCGLVLLANPAVYLVEFFVRVMTGNSVVASLADMGMGVNNFVLDFVTSWYWWMIISTTFFVAVSFLFLGLAARNINPIRGGRIARRQKTPPAVPGNAGEGR